MLGHHFGETSFKRLSWNPSEVLTLCPRAQATSDPVPTYPCYLYLGMGSAVGDARHSWQLLTSQHHLHATLGNPCPLYAPTPLELAAGRPGPAHKFFRHPTLVRPYTTSKIIQGQCRGVLSTCKRGQTSFSPCKEEECGFLPGRRGGGLWGCTAERV